MEPRTKRRKAGIKKTEERRAREEEEDEKREEEGGTTGEARDAVEIDQTRTRAEKAERGIKTGTRGDEKATIAALSISSLFLLLLRGVGH